MTTRIKKSFIAEVEKFHPGSPGDQPEHRGNMRRAVPYVHKTCWRMVCI